MKHASVSSVSIDRIMDGKRNKSPDLLAREEPLEIRLSSGKGSSRIQRAVSVTMRTPGHDFELAIGFLFSEGIIPNYSVVSGIRYCINKETGEEETNIIRVELDEDFELEWKSDRNFYTSSSCGVCGKASIEAIQTNSSCKRFDDDQLTFSAELIMSLPEKLRKEQVIFEHTGGLHAVALFNSKGELLIMREDVGRHNAMDKVIGAKLIQNKTEFSDCITLLSGRASFELIQKAVMAEFKVIAAIGAPSSLAVSLAESFNLSIVGFVKADRLNVYNDSSRIHS